MSRLLLTKREQIDELLRLGFVKDNFNIEDLETYHLTSGPLFQGVSVTVRFFNVDGTVKFGSSKYYSFGMGVNGATEHVEFMTMSLLHKRLIEVYDKIENIIRDKKIENLLGS